MTDLPEMTIDRLKMLIEQGWADFQAYLNTLSEAQLTQPKDAAGWTAKDHLMHLAVWEDGVVALLDKQSRHERMGLSLEVWKGFDFDVMNDVIFKQHQAKSLADVRSTLQHVHEQMMAKLETLTTEDINRPYKEYSPISRSSDPVYETIASDTHLHYEEHQPWIEAIVQAGQLGS